MRVRAGRPAIPPLVALGFAFCLVYEKTGSITPEHLPARSRTLAWMRRAARATFLGAVGFVGAAVPASAQDPVPAPTQPAPQPAPAPSAGRMKLDVIGGITANGRQYALSGKKLTVVGHVKPYVPGQAVRVRISAPKRKPTLVRVQIRKGRDGGTFKVRFLVRRAVSYGIHARHDATNQQVMFDAKAAAGGLKPGSRMAVALLKSGLRALGYPAGYGPGYDDRLGRAVLAFRKTNDMARVYSASRQVYELVFARRGGFKLRYPRAGKHVEADISRQVLVLADKGRVLATYPTSSGAPETPTVLGRYRFYMKQPGTNAKQMYMSNYFIRGYAIHGFPSVPTYEASHGCLRVPNADAVSIYNWIKLGDHIYVYR